jgi:Leucine-rich repeat (LRR) protein
MEIAGAWISEDDMECCASYCGLTNLPDNIGYLKGLVECDFIGNALARIPESIGLLCNLRKLLIRHNNIECLPDSICELHNLEILDASYNR